MICWTPVANPRLRRFHGLRRTENMLFAPPQERLPVLVFDFVKDPQKVIIFHQDAKTLATLLLYFLNHLPCLTKHRKELQTKNYKESMV